jgi:Glycosyl hydrolase family 26
MRLRLLAAAAALAVSSAGLVTSASAPASAGSTPVLFGLTDKWKDQITADNRQLNLHAGIVDLFQPWVADSAKRSTVSRWLTWVRDGGAAPMLTLQPPRSASLRSINAGTYDAKLRAWAHTFKAWGHPMFMRLFPEMNQKSHSYSPGYGGNTAAQFRTAWRHVVSTFRNAGANNVKFIWCPYRVYSTSTPLKSIWPGSSYVNWVAFDAYNYHDSSHAFAWPYDLFAPTVRAIRVLAPHKPLMIAEVGANTDAQKPTWVSRSVTAARSLGVRAMLWFDKMAEHNWRLDSSSAVLSAARTALHSSAVTYAGRRDANGATWNLSKIDSTVAAS